MLPSGRLRSRVITGIAGLCLLGSGIAEVVALSFLFALPVPGVTELVRMGVGSTSPLAFGLLFLESLTILTIATERRTSAGPLGVVTLFGSGLLIVGHAYETPLLYGAPVMPVPLLTSLALHGIAASTLVAAGPQVWPLKLFVGPDTRARLSRALLPSVLVFLLLEGWIDAFSSEHPSATAARSTLSSLLLLGVIEFTIWQVSDRVGRAIDLAVAERRQAEDRLQRSRDSILQLLEGIPALIWRSGADGQCDYFNAAWLAFTGRTLEAELGEGWVEGVHPQDRERCLTLYQAAFTQHQPFEIEYRLRHHTGQYRWILHMGRPLGHLDVSPGGYIGFCYDINDKKSRRVEEEAIAEERRRIAREIHDGLAQDLAALRVRVGLWHDWVDKNPAQMHSELDNLDVLLRNNIREVRRSIFALRPIALNELGFIPALRQFAADFGEQNQLHVSLTCPATAAALPSALEAPLFRIAQETLHNAGKHAAAENIWVDLAIQPDVQVSLRIRDDGRGFDLSWLSETTRFGHFGLNQVRERVEELRGRLDVISKPGGGTTIEAILPLDPLETIHP